jgi:murein DD-endopeptidase MepM/ murein hydrolase activator NlpD
VLTSANQGSANGYGNLIVIDHGDGDGWRSYYGHLSKRSVSQGDHATQGQKIGEVGNTSEPGSKLSPHLHHEVRATDSSYPSNIQKAYFNGVVFGYTNQTVTSSDSCSAGATNPYTATRSAVTATRSSTRSRWARWAGCTCCTTLPAAPTASRP